MEEPKEVSMYRHQIRITASGGSKNMVANEQMAIDKWEGSPLRHEQSIIHIW
jgi:hypothetical protein